MSMQLLRSPSGPFQACLRAHGAFSGAQFLGTYPLAKGVDAPPTMVTGNGKP